jgi:hypothetical protein
MPHIHNYRFVHTPGRRFRGRGVGDDESVATLPTLPDDASTIVATVPDDASTIVAESPLSSPVRSAFSSPASVRSYETVSTLKWSPGDPIPEGGFYPPLKKRRTHGKGLLSLRQKLKNLKA